MSFRERVLSQSLPPSPGTGRQQDIKITGASTLNEDEVQRMVKDAEQFADEDKKQREGIDARNAVRVDNSHETML